MLPVTLTKPYSGDLTDLLMPEEVPAIAVLRRHGFDPVRTYQFWEALTCRLLATELTAAKHPYDTLCGTDRVEVKFSAEHVSRFGGAPHNMMKWTGLKPDAADVTILWGLDALDQVYVWVAPSRVLGAQITIRSPRDLIGHSRSRLNGWSVPPDQVLPAYVRAAQWRPMSDR